MTKVTINTFYEFTDPGDPLYTGFVTPEGTTILAKIKKSMDFFLPYAEYDVGPEALVLKSILFHALSEGLIPAEEYFEKSKCDTFPSPSDGPLFDSRTKIALALWQNANIEKIAAYHQDAYGGSADARKEDALREIGTFGEGTFAVMHGFTATGQKFYNNAYHIPSTIPTRLDASGRIVSDELQIPSSQIHNAVTELLQSTVTKKDSKDARIAAQFGKILHDVTAEAQEEEKNRRSIEVFTRPDPETATDPYIVSNSIIGLMVETRFTLDSPPDNYETDEGAVSLEDYETSLTVAALETVFNYYGKSKNYNIKIRNFTPTDNRGNLIAPSPPTYTEGDGNHSYIANIERDISQTYPQVVDRVSTLVNMQGLGGVMEEEAVVRSILFSLYESQAIKQRVGSPGVDHMRGTALEGILKNNILGPIHPLNKFVDDYDIPLIELVGYETPSFRTGQKYKAEFRISRRKLDLVPPRKQNPVESVAQLADDLEIDPGEEITAENVTNVVTSSTAGEFLDVCDPIEKSTVYANDIAIQAALQRNEEKLEELREKAREQRMRIEAEYRRAMEIFRKDEERIARRRALLSGDDSGTIGDILGEMLQGSGVGEAVGDVVGSIASLWDKPIEGGNPLRIKLSDLKSESKVVVKALKDLKDDYEEWKSEGYDEETGTGGEIKSVVGLDPVDLEFEAGLIEDIVKNIEQLVDVAGVVHRAKAIESARLMGLKGKNFSIDDDPILEIKFARENSDPIPQLDGTSKPGFDLGFKIESIRAAVLIDAPKQNIWPYLLEGDTDIGQQFNQDPIYEAIALLEMPAYAHGYILQMGAILDFLKAPIKALQGSCLDFLRAAPSIALITRFTVPTQIITQPKDEEGLSRLTGPLKEEAEKLQDQWDAYVISVEKGLKQWTTKGKAFEVADILPAFGPGCGKTWEEAMNLMYKEFLDKFNIGVLICEILKCLGLWPIGLNLDLKLTIPKFPKLPIFDYLGPLKKLTLDVLKQMLIRLFCQICRKIIELLKLEACTPESAAMPQRPGTEFPTDLSEYLPVAVDALTDTGVPPELLDGVSDVVDDMAMIMSPVEMCGLMRGNPTERSLMIIKNMIASSAPELSEYLNTTKKIRTLFAKIGFIMGTSVCDALEEAVSQNPIDCRCPEAIDLSNRLSENLVTENQKAAALEIARKNVEDMLNAFQKLAKGEIASDMLGDLVNFGNPNSPLGQMPEGMKELLHMGTKALLEPVKSEFYSDVATYIPAFYDQMTVVERNHSTDGGVDIIAERERIEALERLRLYDYHLALIDQEHPYGLPYFNSGWYKGDWDVEHWKTHCMAGKSLGGRNIDALMNSGGGWNVVYRIMWTLRELLYAPFQEEWYDQDTGATIDIFYDNKITKKIWGFEASKRYLGMPVVINGLDYFTQAGRRKIAKGQKNQEIRPWYMYPVGEWTVFDVTNYGEQWSSLMNSGRWIKRLKMTRGPVYAPWGDVGLALVQPNGWIDGSGNFSPGFFKANGMISSTIAEPNWNGKSIAAATAFTDPGTGVVTFTDEYRNEHLVRSLLGVNFDNFKNVEEDHWSRTCVEKPVMMFKEYPDNELTSQMGSWAMENYDPNIGAASHPFAGSWLSTLFLKANKDANIRKIKDRLKTTWAPAISITNLKGTGLLLESEYKVATLGRGGKCCYWYPGIPGWKEGRPSWHMMVDEMVKSISDRIRELMKVVNDSIRTTSQSAQSSMGRRKYVFLPTLKDFFSKEVEVLENKLHWVRENDIGISNKAFKMMLPPRLLGLDNKKFQQFEGQVQYEERTTSGLYDPYNIIISDPFFLNDISPAENTVIISRCDEFPQTIGNCDEVDPDNPCIRLTDYVGRFNEPYDSRGVLFSSYLGDKFRNVLSAYETATRSAYEANDAVMPNAIEEAFADLRSRFLGDEFPWGDFYKKGFETIIEDIFDQIADSPFFSEEYIADLGNRIAGKTHIDRNGCIVNSDSDPNKGIVDFEKVVRSSMDAVMNEYSSPEAFKNIDYSKPGPFEKAVRKISTELLVRVFMIEYSLRSGIAFSTFNAQRIFAQEGLVKEFIETWIKDYEFSQKRNPILYNIREDFESAIMELAGLNTYEEALSKVVSRQVDPTWSDNFIKFADKLFQPKIVDSPQYAFLNRIPRGNPWKADSLGPITKQQLSDNIFDARRVYEDDEEVNAFLVGEKSISFPQPQYDIYGQTTMREYDIIKDGAFFLEFYVRLDGEANRRMMMAMQAYSDLLEQRYGILIEESFDRPTRGVVSGVYHIDEFTEFASGQLVDMFASEGFGGIGYYPPSEDALSLRPVSAERYPSRVIKLDRYHSTISWKDCPTFWFAIGGESHVNVDAIPEDFDWLGTAWEDYPFDNPAANASDVRVRPSKRSKGWDATRYFVAPADIREAFRSLSQQSVVEDVSENYGRNSLMANYVNTVASERPLAFVNRQVLSTKDQGMFPYHAEIGTDPESRWRSWWNSAPIIHDSKAIGGEYQLEGTPTLTAGVEWKTANLFKITAYASQDQKTVLRDSDKSMYEEFFSSGQSRLGRTVVGKCVEMAGSRVSTHGIEGREMSNGLTVVGDYLDVYPLYSEIYDWIFSNEAFVDVASGEITAGAYLGYGEVTKRHWDAVVGANVFDPVRPEDNPSNRQFVNDADSAFDEVYEHWTQYVIDIVGLAAPSYTNPGESYHSRKDLPVLSWDSLESISRADGEQFIVAYMEAEQANREMRFRSQTTVENPTEQMQQAIEDPSLFFPDRWYGSSPEYEVKNRILHYELMLERAPLWTWTFSTTWGSKGGFPHFAGAHNYSTWLFGPGHGMAPYNEIAGNVNNDSHHVSTFADFTPHYSPGGSTFAWAGDKDYLFRANVSSRMQAQEVYRAGIQVAGGWADRVNTRARLVHHQPYLYTWVPIIAEFGRAANEAVVNHQNHFQARLSRPLGKITDNYASAYAAAGFRADAATNKPALAAARNQVSHEHNWWELNGYEIDNLDYKNPSTGAGSLAGTVHWKRIGDGGANSASRSLLLRNNRVMTTNRVTQVCETRSTNMAAYGFVGDGAAIAERNALTVHNDGADAEFYELGSSQAQAMATWSQGATIAKRLFFDGLTADQMRHVREGDETIGLWNSGKFFKNAVEAAAHAYGTKGFRYLNALRHDADSYRCPIRLLVTKVEYIINGEVADSETYIDYDIPKTLEGADYQLEDLSLTSREILGWDERYTGEDTGTDFPAAGHDADPTVEELNERVTDIEETLAEEGEVTLDSSRGDNADAFYDPHNPNVNRLVREPIFSEDPREHIFKYPKSVSNATRRDALQRAANRAVQNYKFYQENTSHGLRSKFRIRQTPNGKNVENTHFDWGYMDKYRPLASHASNANAITKYTFYSDASTEFDDDLAEVVFNEDVEKYSAYQLCRLSFAARADTILHGFMGARTDDLRFSGLRLLGNANQQSIWDEQEDDSSFNQPQIMNIPFTTVASIYSDAANIEVLLDYQSGADQKTIKEFSTTHMKDGQNTFRVLSPEEEWPSNVNNVQGATKIAHRYRPNEDDGLPRRFSRDQIEIDAQFSRRPGKLIKDFNFTEAPSFDDLKFHDIESDEYKPWHEAMDVPSYFPTVGIQKFLSAEDRVLDASAFPGAHSLTVGRTLAESSKKKIRSFIDYFTSTWISQRKYEGFWGRTSSKAWIKGVIPAENYSRAVPGGVEANDDAAMANHLSNRGAIMCDNSYEHNKLNGFGRTTVISQRINSSMGEDYHPDLAGLFPPQLPMEAPTIGKVNSPMGPHAADAPVHPSEHAPGGAEWRSGYVPSVIQSLNEPTRPAQWYPISRWGQHRSGEQEVRSHLYSPIVGDMRHNIRSVNPTHPGFLSPSKEYGTSPWANVEHKLAALGGLIGVMHPLHMRKLSKAEGFNVASMLAKEATPQYFLGTTQNIDRYAAVSAIKVCTRYHRERGPLSDDFLRELAGMGSTDESMDFRSLIDNSTVKFGIRLVQAANRNVSRRSVPFDFSADASRAPNSADGRIEEIFEEMILGERTYYLKLGLDENTPKETVCVPLVTQEKTVPATCLVNPNSISDLFSQHKGFLLDKMVNSPEFELMAKYIYPSERMLAMASIYSTMALSSKHKLQGLLDPSKNALANLISLSGEKKIEYGNPWAKGTAFAGDNSNVDLAKQMGNMITSEGPKAGCGEMPNFDWKKFLKKLLEYILYLVPSILRAIALMIDPAYKDMHKLFHQCTPKKEHVNSLTWGGVFPFTEYGWGLGVKGVEGKEIHNGVVRGNKYAPVFPAFPIDLFNGLTFIPVPPFVIPNPSFFKSLGKFASYIMGAMPFGVGGGAGVQLPACMGENVEGSDEAQKKLLDPATKYGNLLTPFGMLALSMPELPNERKRDMDKMCAEPWKKPTVEPVNVNFNRTIRDNINCKDGEKEGDQASNAPGWQNSQTDGNADNLFED